MKVCHVLSSLRQGGVSRVVIDLSTEMVKQGHDVTIILIESAIDFQLPDDVEIIVASDFSSYIELPGKFKRATLGRLVNLYINRKKCSAKVIKDYKLNNFDLVLFHCLTTKILFSQNILKNSYYVLHNYKSLHLKSKWFLPTLFNKFFFKNSLKDNRLITVSKSVREDVIVNFNFDSQKIVTIYNPIDRKRINSLANEYVPDLKSKSYILAVGQFSKQKRFDLLIKAYEKGKFNKKLVNIENKFKPI